eukprot:TRINITY_DN1667_c0_g2_i1.p1 TRINITY_DN1667_c0_g2~~TRINITY_DN1667_c0_g2_i1.p1  ORF type:complete len:339 (-),score=59.34 TRINITY_DN1667_c0_g2_i1:28-999(-)
MTVRGRKLGVVLTVVVLLSVIGLSKGALSYLSNDRFGTTFYLAPLQYNGSMEGSIGRPLTSSAYWFLAQWSSPAPLSPTSSIGTGPGPCSLRGADWWSATQSARLCYESSSNSIELAQSGGNDLKCGLEYDFFVSPTAPGYKINTPYNWVTVPAIGVLSNIYFNFSVQLPYRTVNSRCGPLPCGSSQGIDYAYTTAAVTLASPLHQQSLFYQISLSDSRAGLGCGDDPCKSESAWFFTTNPWGINDSIGLFGYPCLSPTGQGWVRVQVNILPRLLNALAEGTKYGMINDPNNWYVNGIYIGGGGNGNFAQTLLISNVSIGANF